MTAIILLRLLVFLGLLGHFAIVIAADGAGAPRGGTSSNTSTVATRPAANFLVRVLELPPRFNAEILSALEERGKAKGLVVRNDSGCSCGGEADEVGEVVVTFSDDDQGKSGSDRWIDPSQFALEVMVHRRALGMEKKAQAFGRVRTLQCAESHGDATEDKGRQCEAPHQRQRRADPNHAPPLVLIPYYAGLALTLLGKDGAAKLEADLFDFLRSHPLWLGTHPRRRFFVLGRVANEFVQSGQPWGSTFLQRDELRNATVVAIESIPGCCNLCLDLRKHGRPMKCERMCWGTDGHIAPAHVAAGLNLIGVPYPSLHRSTVCAAPPRNDDDDDDDGDEKEGGNVNATMRNRTILATFVGETAHSEGLSVMRDRISIAKQCRQRPSLCAASSYRGPDYLLRQYGESVFCIQPPGDTLTRKGIFDSIQLGCIPVVLDARQMDGGPGGQYPLHLPSDPYWHLSNADGDGRTEERQRQGGTETSALAVCVPPDRHGAILDFLSEIPEGDVSRMQRNVAKLAPRLRYSSGATAGTELGEDAFSVMVSRLHATMVANATTAQHF